MINTSLRTAFAIFIFVTALQYQMWIDANGFTSVNALENWAWAILSTSESGNYRPDHAFYPPLSSALILAVHSVLGWMPIDIPKVASSLLITLLALHWFSALRKDASYRKASSGIIVAALMLNPFFLRAAADGTQALLVIFGLSVFARGLVLLRLSGAAPDMMRVSVGLLIVALSDEYGLLLAVGAAPFVVLAAQREKLQVSPFGYLLAVVSPILIAIASLAYLSVVFDTSLVAALRSTGVQESPFVHTAILGSMALLTGLALITPKTRRTTTIAVLCAFGACWGGYALNAALSYKSDPLLTAAPIIAVFAAAIRSLPYFRARTFIILLILTFSAAVSIVGAKNSTSSAEWLDAVTTNPLSSRAIETDLFEGLGFNKTIMIDGEENPDLVVRLWRNHDLIVAGDADYDNAMLTGSLFTPYVIVRNNSSEFLVKDEILRTFPSLGRNDSSTYRAIIEGQRWTVFKRQATGQKFNE